MALRLLAFYALLTCATFGQTSREYYNELYAAGGLDQILSEYACFPEEATGNFFLFAKTTDIRGVLEMDGAFKKLPKSAQAILSKDTIVFRGYNKGVPFDAEEPYEPDGDTWIGATFKLDGKTLARIRFGIAWPTLRYRRAVEIINPDGTTKIEAGVAYGRCERVSTRVKQRGKSN